MNLLTIKPHHITPLPSRAGVPERAHEFDERSIAAVNTSLTARWPLLVRGEPGVGKTQLAEAVAIELQRAYYPFTVDARTESRDLLWHFDAVARLAQAQLYAALGQRANVDVTRDLAAQRFVRPGPLWWAFDTESARRACGDGVTPLDQGDNAARHAQGWVLLIDEIDKAESDVPNGLLEALGAGQFTPFEYEQPVVVAGTPPLIIITTNEERVLPDAFVRRCLVLQLALPREDDRLMAFLKQRGEAHFGDQTTDEVLHEAARQLVEDRKATEAAQLSPLPGQAEYLDLVRAVIGLAAGDVAAQKNLLASAARFTLRKHPDLSTQPTEINP
jgi:MoxR-like ATPase